jgi:hypothetical protein
MFSEQVAQVYCQRITSVLCLRAGLKELSTSSALTEAGYINLVYNSGNECTSL